MKVTITWIDPPERDFYRVEILRNDGTGTMVTGNVRATILKDVKRYEDIEVVSGQNYLYRFRVSDLYSNTRLSDEYAVAVIPPAASAPPPDTSQSTGTTSPMVDVPATQTQESGAPIVQSTGITDPVDRAILLSRFAISRDEPAETQYRFYLVSDMAEFGITSTAAFENAMVNFVVYGASEATRKLGAGERRALLRDYFETVGRGSVTWSDIEKMATGVKPLGRNLYKERAQLPQVLAVWIKMLGRNPNFQDMSEDLAWNTMMYRVRFTRDLSKEQQGITEFRAIFKRAPTSPLDWAAVRALGYVLN